MFSFKQKIQIRWRIILNSFLSAGGVVIYVIIVSAVMQNGDKLFGKMDNITGPVIFLLLFVFSTLISGALMLGLPVWRYLEGKKNEAWLQFVYNITWLFIILVVILATRIYLS